MYIFGPQLNRLALCWYLLNSLKGHNPRRGARDSRGLDNTLQVLNSKE